MAFADRNARPARQDQTSEGRAADGGGALEPGPANPCAASLGQDEGSTKVRRRSTKHDEARRGTARHDEARRGTTRHDEGSTRFGDVPRRFSAGSVQEK